MDRETTRLGLNFLEAFNDAMGAKRKYDTNDGDDYDPCGDTKRQCKAELDLAMVKLVESIKACAEAPCGSDS